MNGGVGSMENLIEINISWKVFHSLPLKTNQTIVMVLLSISLSLHKIDKNLREVFIWIYIQKDLLSFGIC